MKPKPGKKGRNRSTKRLRISPKLIVAVLSVAAVVLLSVLSLLTGPQTAVERVAIPVPSVSTVVSPTPSSLTSDYGITHTESPAQTPSSSEGKNGKTVNNSASAVVAAKTVSVKRGELYLIIDDVGNNLGELEPFLGLPFPVTLAVMPGRPYTEAAINRINAAGKPFIIHQPMEPIGDADPGVCAVTSGMSKDEIRSRIRENLRSMPGALGMNNHMGSRITADVEKLTPVLEVLKENDLVFIDSFTSPDSKSAGIAKEMGLAVYKRNTMFLDNDKDRESIEEMINAARGVAAREGHAIMIGHVWSSELADLLLELYPSLLDDGYELKDVRDLLIKGSEQ
ncbi:MAG: divergent polysaccharide deacetylase family protein [Spirochaetales bacterium]|nr:divergent polysaccharide deacetylase family protein [Spirochaetales bacterium]